MLRSSPPNLRKLKHNLNHSQKLRLSMMIALKVVRHACRHREKLFLRSVNKSVRKS